MHKHGGHAKRCCKRVSRLVGHDLVGKLTDVILFFFFNPFHACLEEGATDQVEHSSTPPLGSG